MKNEEEVPEKTRAPEVPGVMQELGKLPAGAIVSEAALAGMLRRHPCSIRRAVRRGELPPPVRLCGHPAWTAGHLVRYVENRLADAAREAEQEKRRISRLSA